MLLRYIALIIFSALIFISCDIVEPPYQKGGEPIPLDTAKRNVLLEDFTGFRCGNCPEAAHLAHQIAETYPGKVIKIALHAGPLSLPTPVRKYDFRTDETKELAQYYNLIATPYGMVNRASFGGQTLLAPTSWGGHVTSELEKDADLKIDLNASYSEGNKEISLNVELEYVKPGTSDHFIAVYILEDSVVQYQQDDREYPNIHVQDYVHDNVMRGSFSGTWGLQISDRPISIGQKFNLPFKYIIPENKDWRVEKLSLVVFVHDNTSKEVLQVEKIYLFED